MKKKNKLKYFLASFFILVILISLIAGMWLIIRLQRQPLNLKSKAAPACEAKVYFSPGNKTLYPNEEFQVKIIADLKAKALAMSGLTISYDPKKLTVTNAIAQSDGTFIIKDFPKDIRMGNELNSIFVFPNLGKIHILNSCKTDKKNGRCLIPVRGREILLAQIPFKVKNLNIVKKDETELRIEESKCGNSESLSLIVEDVGDLKASGQNILGQVNSALFIIIPKKEELSPTPTPKQVSSVPQIYFARGSLRTLQAEITGTNFNKGDTVDLMGIRKTGPFANKNLIFASGIQTQFISKNKLKFRLANRTTDYKNIMVKVNNASGRRSFWHTIQISR